jgi:hypothetical protein
MLIALAGLPQLVAQQKSQRLLPRYLTVGAPDQAAGERRLTEFRRQGLAGDYFLDFNLEQLPRRGARTVIPGRWWGTPGRGAPLTRVELETADGPERLLVRGGAAARVWRQGETADQEPAAWFEPLAGTMLTPFDLSMPFLHWQDWVYEGVARGRQGRASHVFLLYPPEEIAAAQPDLAGVRIHLDDQFNALLQVTRLDADEQPAQTLTVLNLRRLDDQYIISVVELRDERTRDKTRFVVNEARVGLDFSPAIFSPAALSRAIPPPANLQRVR